MGLNPVTKNGVATFTGNRATDLSTISDPSWGTWTGSHYPLLTNVGTFTTGTPFQRIYARVKVNDFFTMQLTSPTANGSDGVLFKFFDTGKSMKVWAPQVSGFPGRVGGFPTYAESRKPDWVTVGSTYELIFYSSINGYTVAIKNPTTGMWVPCVTLSLRDPSSFQASAAYSTLFNVSNIYATIYATGGTPEFSGLTFSYSGYSPNPYWPDGGSLRRFYRCDFSATSNPYDIVNDSSAVISNTSMTKYTTLPAASAVYSSGGILYVTTAVTGRAYLMLPNTNGFYPNTNDYGHFYLKIEGLSGGLGFANVLGQSLYFNSNVSGSLYPVTLEANGSR